MKISIIGAGYVGLVVAGIFSNFGHLVSCIDFDEDKINQLTSGRVPIYEPLLGEKILQGIQKKSLHFTTKYDCVAYAESIFLAVGTPDLPSGEADLSFIYGAIDNIKKFITKDAILVVKSTVPPNTCSKIIQYLRSGGLENHVVMNPEFLRQGSSVNDFLSPDRIVIGCSSQVAAEKMLLIYASWQNTPKIVTDLVTAEMIKYAANAFLATKIAFINEMSNSCNYFGADVDMLSQALALDKRIGNGCLKAGPGFGGSCFPKDINALLHSTKQIKSPILQAVIESNSARPYLMVDRIKEIVGNLENIKIGILGLSFKAHTDDVRFSPAVRIIQLMLKSKPIITAFDPEAQDNAKILLPDIKYVSKPIDTANDAECLIVLTEWPEFQSINFNIVFSKMKKPVIIDFRNLLESSLLKQIGFNYYCL